MRVLQAANEAERQLFGGLRSGWTAKAKFGEQRGAEKFMNIYILDTYINSPVSEYKLNTDGKYMPILF